MMQKTYPNRRRKSRNENWKLISSRYSWWWVLLVCAISRARSWWWGKVSVLCVCWICLIISSGFMVVVFCPGSLWRISHFPQIIINVFFTYLIRRRRLGKKFITSLVHFSVSSCYFMLYWSFEFYVFCCLQDTLILLLVSVFSLLGWYKLLTIHIYFLKMKWEFDFIGTEERKGIDKGLNTLLCCGWAWEEWHNVAFSSQQVGIVS